MQTSVMVPYSGTPTQLSWWPIYMVPERESTHFPLIALVFVANARFY
jgi:hypothetical protein